MSKPSVPDHRPAVGVQSRRLRSALAAALTLLVLGAGVVLADSSYDLSWWTVAGGGGDGSGGAYTLSGAAGQADAGQMSGGSYQLSGGFWVGGVAASPSRYHTYLPLVRR
jgi:hypothetical protein